ncbi:DUF1203 domain-containing protein [Kineosporia sp. J2-2]|uniref:DUF1203 domain-containing protein n=1 Tax=Kineosporia corallincola TaxID=2835133 RepID=A0ABS5TG85_9ACTN|nr:DUF1203 domain-containing protein [Kineosporia corallincola]MBT0770107.1 DUF1203 domain-containing protein [Kineosporia corallincola]
MQTYRVVPIDQGVAWRVRATLRSPECDYPAYVDLATGGGPCRVCLTPFRAGVDRAVWFVYDPVRGRVPAPLPGPVQIHEEGCPAYESSGAGLDSGVFPDDLTVTLQGYPDVIASGGTAFGGPVPGGRDVGRAVSQTRVATGAAGVREAAAHLFSSPSTAYLHVRRADDGCFLCEVVRSAACES